MMNSSKQIKIAVLITVLGSLMGCESTGSSQGGFLANTMNAIAESAERQTVERWDNASNKTMRDAFLVKEINEKGRSTISLVKPLLDVQFKLDKHTTSSIFLRSELKNLPSMSDVDSYISRGIYNTEQDLASKYFIEQARKQGHVVKVYRPALAGDINRGLIQRAEPMNNAYPVYGAEPALVEYDKDGRPVAIMTRTWLKTQLVWVNAWLYTNIYTSGDGIRWFENNFGNDVLANNLMRTYN